MRRLQYVRIILYAIALCYMAYALNRYFRPYERGADPAAGYQIRSCQLTADRAYFWLDLDLKSNDLSGPDWQRPVLLRNASGQTFTPAMVSQAVLAKQENPSLQLRFWLGREDLAGPLTLQINNGTLQVKTSLEIPSLGKQSMRTFSNNQW